MDGVAITCQKLLVRFGDIQFFGIGQVIPNPSWKMASHRHPHHHELIVILSGAVTVRTPVQEVSAKRGDILFYEAGLMHEETGSRTNPFRSLFFGFSVSDYELNLPLHSEDREGRVREMIAWLYQDIQRGRAEAECLPLINSIVAELERLAGSSPYDGWIQSIRKYLQDHHAADLNLDVIARQAGMSRFAFIRKFRRLSGRTPMEELRRIRLNEARLKILTTTLPLKAVADAVGIGDEYQLSKLFRRYFHISPSELRSSSGSIAR